MANPDRRATAWGVFLLALLALLGWEIQRGVRFDTNILRLLPPTEGFPVFEHAVQAFSERLSNRVVFLVDDAEAADALVEELEAAPEFTDLRFEVNEAEERAFYETYFPIREHLLPPDADPITDAAQLIHSPLVSGFSRLLDQDPLLLFPGFLQRLPPPPEQFEQLDGRLVLREDGRVFYLVLARMSGSPFSRGAQGPAVERATRILGALATRFPHAEFLTTGMVYFAKAGADSAEREATLISTGSLLGVLLLMLLTFRSPRHLMLCLLAIGSGFLCAFSISFLVFERLHLITLGFGASLIGICVDYSFHYFAEQFAPEERWDSERALVRIRPGITLGLVTSLLGYAGLMLAPFPGLRQMAVFSSIGLLGAFGTVYFAYPVLMRKVKPIPDPRLLSLADWLLDKRLPIRTGAALVLLVSAAGLFVLQHNDDIRILQTPREDLVVQEERIRGMLGGMDGGQFLVLIGDSEERLLQNGEQVVQELSALVEQGVLESFQSLSPLMPSEARQRASFRLLQEQSVGIRRWMEETGFKQEVIDGLEARLQMEPQPVQPEALLASPALASFRHLWIEAHQGFHASIVLLSGVQQPERLVALADEYVVLPYMAYIDRVNDLSTVMQDQRRLARRLVILSYALIAVFLFLRYGWTRFLRIFLPPCLAALLSLGLLGISGEPITFFHYMAILLVLGIGIDYTLFFAEAQSGDRVILFAVLLSAITTILSFGLLAFSSTLALSGFGKTVFLGILFALLFSPAARK